MSDKETIKRVSAVEDAVTYPILTKDVSGSTPTTPGAAAPMPGGGQSLDAVVQNSIRTTLGWRYRVDDTKGFVAALRKTFLLKDVEGHTEWDYQPQSYSVQSDMGEITGAQASIFARAKNALDQTLPLLSGLTPLLNDPDFEDIEAMRSIVRDELTQLVGEFGQVAGPRVQRVDSIFKLLIGPAPDYHNPIKVKGHLGLLGGRLGMQRRWVNSIEDEQDLTNFLILVDYTNSLYQTWVAQRDFFSRGKHGQPFLGTQLVLISQALASAVEMVQDAYDALDSVFVGPAERQSIFLNYFGEFAPITLGELLGWGMDFFTNEGPQLLQESGKDGVVAFRSTINRIRYLMFLTVEYSRSGSKNLGKGVSTYRAQAALESVRDSLKLVDREADKIRRDAPEDDPTLTAEGAVFQIFSLDNVNATLGQPTQLTVGGKNISPGARMLLISTQHPERGFEGTAIPDTATLSKGVTKDGNFITAAFNFPSTFAASKQTYTMVVINPDGAYAWLEQALDTAELSGASGSLPTPEITSATLKKGKGGTLVLKIKGEDFAEGLTIECTGTLGSYFTPSPTPKSISSNEIEYVIPSSDWSSGDTITGITVTNPDGGTAGSWTGTLTAS